MLLPGANGNNNNSNNNNTVEANNRHTKAWERFFKKLRHWKFRKPDSCPEQGTSSENCWEDTNLWPLAGCSF